MGIRAVAFGSVLAVLVLGCTSAAPPASAAADPLRDEAPESETAVPNGALGTPATPEVPAASDTPDTADGAVVEPALTGPTLVVARSTGIVEVTLDGTEVRALSATPARSPRWLRKERALVFLGQAGGRSRDLRYLTRDGATERVLARLPLRPPCPAAVYRRDDQEVPELDLRSEGEFWVTADDTHACLLASDYAHDLRSIRRDVAVRLGNGKLERALVFGGESCDAPNEAALSACDGQAAGGEVAEGGDIEDIESPIGGYVESRSPDSNWLLINVGSALGDLLHINLVLYDSRSAKIYPLPTDQRDWPVAVALPQPPEDEAMMPGLPEVIAGGVVTWVGDHHLVVDHTLYVAGEAIVPLGGDVAI